MKKSIITLAILLIILTRTNAQVPQKVNYQAMLRDNSGVVLSQKAVKIRFEILKGNSSGPSVYSETHSITTTEQGIINLQIGTGISDDDFSSIDWTNDSYFLSVEMDANGGNNFTHLGASEIVSVPYAITARTAEIVSWKNIQNKPEFAYVAITGNYGDLLNKPWTKAASNIYYNEGKVGIGTSAPDYKLQIVDSNNKVVLGYQPAYDGPFLNLYSSITEAAPMLAFGVAKREYYKYERVLALKDWAYIYGNNLNLGVSILPDMQYAPEGLYIKRGGFVGIGIENPKAKLEIADGDVYIKDIERGIIMTSPNGQCWRGVLNDSGILEFSAIDCP
jgi:hypothetical protein